MPSKLFTPAVTTILVLSVIGFLLSAFRPALALDWFAVNPARVLRGMVWQLVTYPFVLDRPGALIFNAIVILFAGSAVERQWRTLSFVSLWASHLLKGG